MWRRTLKYSVPLAFICLALFGGIAIENSASGQAAALHKAQLQSCVRGNSFRAESNRRIVAHLAEASVIRKLLYAAIKAREANYVATHLPSDLEAAHEYYALIGILNSRVHFQRTPLVDCNKAYPKP